MEYIDKKGLAKLKGNAVKVIRVYKPYRMFYNDALKRMEFTQYGSDDLYTKKGRDFTPITGKADYSKHKKKYDIVLQTPKPVTITVQRYDPNIGEKVDIEITDNEFTVQGLSFTIIRNMMECSVAFNKVPTDSSGKPLYDWEEEFMELLEGNVFNFSTQKEDYDIGGNKGQYDKFNFIHDPSRSEVKEVDNSPNEPVDQYDDELPF